MRGSRRGSVPSGRSSDRTGIHFIDGDIVHKGDLLLVIDSRPHEIVSQRTQAQLPTATAGPGPANRQIVRTAALVEAGPLGDGLRMLSSGLAPTDRVIIDGLLFHGMNVDILARIGFVVPVGLAAKNAILIVKFARQAQNHGASAKRAAVEAAGIGCARS